MFLCLKRLFYCVKLVLAAASSMVQAWEPVDDAQGQCDVHPECSMACVKDQLYLIGGRGNPTTDRYDPEQNRWDVLPAAPFQMHHFQAVVINGKIGVIGGFTGKFPAETPIPNIWFFNPDSKAWEKGPEIPEGRRRGSAGAVVDGDYVYLVGGIINGHISGYVPWLDRWNWKTNEWTILQDAPHPRDHFEVGTVDGQIIAAGGRTTDRKNKQPFAHTVSEVDAYDIETGQWKTLNDRFPIPRAGTMAITIHGNLLIIGGESGIQKQAHSEVSLFDVATESWRDIDSLSPGRHGGGLARLGDFLYIAGGNGMRGGGDARTDLQKMKWSKLLQPAMSPE